jgi:molecular chaperone HscA
MVAECKSLATFELKGIPRLPPGMARIEVTFQLDADALLTVTAKELMTGATQSVAVKPTYGLTSEEVDRLVLDSLENARSDFLARDVAEARVELGRVVLAVRRAGEDLGHIPELLPAEEREVVDKALSDAQQVMDDSGADKARLDEIRNHLERVSEPFARRRMERALAAGMQGKTLHEIEQTLADEESLEQKRGAHHAEILSTD